MDIINKNISVKQLLLDPNNFRLDYNVTQDEIDESQFLSEQSSTLEKLEEENVEELRQSILENGFIEIDRIVVKNSALLNGDLPYYIVVEGNRRTAALQTIYDDYLKGRIQVTNELKAQFEGVNVCLINSKDSQKILTLSASLMGIRHVSGPKKWKGVQAAKLIDQLRKHGKTFKDIGHLLSIEEDDARRRHDGFLAFCQMKKDPTFGAKCNYNHYALLLEFIPNKHSREWLKWNGSEFSNADTKLVLYQHLSKEEGQRRAEINNTAEARAFNRYLAIPEYSIKLASGKVRMSDLPDLPKNHSSKIAYISKFNSFLNNLDEDTTALIDINEELNKVSSTLIDILSDTEE